jgi:quercetin dioxygenase-like cupin family protein
MSPPENEMIVRRSLSLEATPARRSGFRERKLLTHADSGYQNVVLMDADIGATVEDHELAISESVFVLQGQLEVTSGERRETLGSGALCYFAPGSRHSMRCIEGPAQFLVLFAPPALARNPDA